MSSRMITQFLVAAVLLTSLAAEAQSKKPARSAKRVDVVKDVDSLGGNEALAEMAVAMDPNNKARVVQNRQVDRNMRLELDVNYGQVAGGDSYLRTQNLGAAAEFHINPRWSLGVRYYDYGNTLTPEGERVFENAQNRRKEGLPTDAVDIDYPLNSVMGIISWYPIYGKTNLMDYGIAQFDLYLLAGGGQIEMSSGSTSIYTGGAGVGFWLSKHFSLRTELRYQNYEDKIITGSRNIDTVTGQVGIGFLL